jgi:hypothetical protein
LRPSVSTRWFTLGVSQGVVSNNRGGLRFRLQRLVFGFCSAKGELKTRKKMAKYKK